MSQFEVIWVNRELVEICAQMRAEQETKGKALSTADSWIAATAILLRCPLVAEDKDFERVDGLDLIAWAG